MTFVRGILPGLVICLAVSAAPATATATASAPAAAPAVSDTAQATKGWTVLREWKGGVLRTCRGEWDGDSFRLKIQLVNRAEQGRRGAVLGVRSGEFPEWQSVPLEPIEAGSKLTYIDADVAERPKVVKLRGKITKGESKSSWGKVAGGDDVKFC